MLVSRALSPTTSFAFTIIDKFGEFPAIMAVRLCREVGRLEQLTGLCAGFGLGALPAALAGFLARLPGLHVVCPLLSRCLA